MYGWEVRNLIDFIRTHQHNKHNNKPLTTPHTTPSSLSHHHILGAYHTPLSPLSEPSIYKLSHLSANSNFKLSPLADARVLAMSPPLLFLLLILLLSPSLGMKGNKRKQKRRQQRKAKAAAAAGTTPMGQPVTPSEPVNPSLRSLPQPPVVRSDTPLQRQAALHKLAPALHKLTPPKRHEPLPAMRRGANGVWATDFDPRPRLSPIHMPSGNVPLPGVAAAAAGAGSSGSNTRTSNTPWMEDGSFTLKEIIGGASDGSGDSGSGGSGSGGGRGSGSGTPVLWSTIASLVSDLQGDVDAFQALADTDGSDVFYGSDKSDAGTHTNTAGDGGRREKELAKLSFFSDAQLQANVFRRLRGILEDPGFAEYLVATRFADNAEQQGFYRLLLYLASVVYSPETPNNIQEEGTWQQAHRIESNRFLAHRIASHRIALPRIALPRIALPRIPWYRNRIESNLTVSDLVASP